MVMSSPHSRPITTVPALLCEDNLPDSGQKLLSLKITPSPALPCLPRAPLSVPWEHIFTNHLHSCLVLGSASEEDLPPHPPPPLPRAWVLKVSSLPQTLSSSVDSGWSLGQLPQTPL